MNSIGIDVGGTFIKGGRVAPDGTVLQEVRIPTEAERGADHVITNIISVANSLAANQHVTGIGIGMPGLVSADRNTVKYPPNLPGWKIITLGTHVEEVTKLNTIVDNDANCAALGEATFGAGKNISHFILATLGTGVGGGIIADGKIFRGETGGAGEIGHTTVDMNGPKCKCGSRGCVEAYVGNFYFCERVTKALAGRPESLLNEMMRNNSGVLTPEIVSQAATQGDIFARDRLHEAGMVLGVGLANAMALFDIHTVILGGGVAQAGELIFGGVREAIMEYSQAPMAQDFKVLAASLGNRAGILGASQLLRITDYELRT